MGETLSHPVRDVASAGPVTVDESTSLRLAARSLWMSSIGALVVLREGKPVGILSERDIVEHVGRGADPATTTAGDAMTSPIVLARPYDRVLDATIAMLDHGIRHLPVIDDAGGLVGMVSIRDLLRPMLVDALELPHADAVS